MSRSRSCSGPPRWCSRWRSCSWRPPQPPASPPAASARGHTEPGPSRPHHLSLITHRPGLITFSKHWQHLLRTSSDARYIAAGSSLGLVFSLLIDINVTKHKMCQNSENKKFGCRRNLTLIIFALFSRHLRWCEHEFDLVLLLNFLYICSDFWPSTKASTVSDNFEFCTRMCFEYNLLIYRILSYHLQVKSYHQNKHYVAQPRVGDQTGSCGDSCPVECGRVWSVQGTQGRGIIIWTGALLYCTAVQHNVHPTGLRGTTQLRSWPVCSRVG